MKIPLRFVLLLLLAGLFTACKPYLISDTFTSPGGKLFWDDFSDQSGGWQQASNPNGTLAYADGAYHITVQTAGFELGSLSGHAYRDVRVEVDAIRLAGPDQNLFGLICRARDHDNYYFFVISSDGYYAVGKFKNGSASLVGQKMMAFSPAVAPGIAPNHLRFDCTGQTLTAYVNGQAVALVKDADYPDGDVGLLAGAFDTPGVGVSFDNFVVTKP